MPLETAKAHANGVPVLDSRARSSYQAEVAFLLRHPELEDIELVEDGLAKSKDYSEGRATISLYHGTVKDGMKLLRDVQQDTLDEVMRSCIETKEGHMNERKLRICFIRTPGDHMNWQSGNFSIPPDIVQILRTSGLSDVLLSNIYSKTGYWAKMGNLQFSGSDRFETCYQYRCGWHAAISYIHLVRTKSESTYFCINYPDKAFKRLQQSLQNERGLVLRDFLLDALAADVSSKQWLLDIHKVRDELLKAEARLRDWTEESKTNKDFNEDITRQLHHISQKWLSISQDTEDFQAQLEFLQDSNNTFRKRFIGWQSDGSADLDDSFKALQSQSEVCTRWTKTYRSRTEVCINLLYHLANQAEARTSKDIQVATAKVAEQTQRDSASMIVIATMTLFFLPGTFVSSIMSTVFFNYSGDDLQVSQKGWILAPAIVPLTLLVFGLWLGWLYRSRRDAFNRVVGWVRGRERRNSLSGA